MEEFATLSTEMRTIAFMTESRPWIPAPVTKEILVPKRNRKECKTEGVLTSNDERRGLCINIVSTD